jgi:hypothetical protein
VWNPESRKAEGYGTIGKGAERGGKVRKGPEWVGSGQGSGVVVAYDNHKFSQHEL